MKDIIIRAFKTFWQAAAAVIIIEAESVVMSIINGEGNWKPLLMSLLTGAIAAGLSAVYNAFLRPKEPTEEPEEPEREPFRKDNIIKCIHTESSCYKTSPKIKPVGIVVHSTGANNTSIKRYCQPSADDPNYQTLISVIGLNRYGNSWNRDIDKSTHYIIGRVADGTVKTVQMLPENIAAWGVGSGKNGSYNYDPTAHIQFEICEDNLEDEEYFDTVMAEAAELCADICNRYGFEVSSIVSHKEASSAGYASAHADIDHWLSRFGKNMDWFREYVESIR